MRGTDASSIKSKAQRRVWTTSLLTLLFVGVVLFSFSEYNADNKDEVNRVVRIKEGERSTWENTKSISYSSGGSNYYGMDSISSTQPRYGRKSTKDDDSKEELASPGENNGSDDDDDDDDNKEMNAHAAVKRNSKKFLNNFNGAVAMHRGSCKEGSQIQTPWIGKDGKKISLGSCTKKALAVLPDTDPLAFQRYNTCAVVGSGGIMVHKSVAADNLGEAIDKHDAVFRFNLAPTKGFEKSVGSKTTFRLINRKHFGFREFANETSLQHTTTPDVMKQFWDYKSLHPDLPTYPIDGSFYKYVMSDKDVANSRPSNGYLGLNLALMICDKINVYGFARNWKQRNMRYHYFNREEPNESQMLRDGKGEMPLLEHLVKKNKNRIKMVHT